MVDVRKGQYRGKLSRDAFRTHFHRSFFDSAFDTEREAIARLEQIAWDAYGKSRKAPRTVKAGKGFADPDYDLSVEWLETRNKLRAAELHQKNPHFSSRALVICAAHRNDGTCPGEISKTFRLTKLATEVLEGEGIECDLLDLSDLVSEYGRKIHPCKACVSTAMPLCHWPCSCYPNHALGQSDDWMAEIYERWVLAHGILILTPVYWGQAPGALKLMMDRLVCADGGNPDPTTTHGKRPEEAKAIEMQGWDYPKHLAGRVYGVVVHGDVSGESAVRDALAEWLDWMELIDAGEAARLDRLIGYFKPYATSHEELDADAAVQEETRNAARALAAAIKALRQGKLIVPDAGLKAPRRK
jgi:multimeric flavodoxin WrbA